MWHLDHLWYDDNLINSYDDETIGDIEVPLRYKHIVKQWVPKDIPQLNTIFCVNSAKLERNENYV